MDRDRGVRVNYFCRICQYQRFASVVVPDVTTLNPNVLFEIGYALGLDRLILPIRDTSIVKDKKAFDELELLLWFGFLGVIDQHGEGRYAYQFHYGVKRLLQEATAPPKFVVHPAFRVELGVR